MKLLSIAGDSQIDWTDDTPISLEKAAAIAFPDGSVNANSLKRHARKNTLRVYRPGKRYLTTLRDIRAMLETISAPKPAPAKIERTKNYGVFSEQEISARALEQSLEQLRQLPRKR